MIERTLLVLTDFRAIVPMHVSRRMLSDTLTSASGVRSGRIANTFCQRTDL